MQLSSIYGGLRQLYRELAVHSFGVPALIILVRLEVVLVMMAWMLVEMMSSYLTKVVGLQMNGFEIQLVE